MILQGCIYHTRFRKTGLHLQKINLTKFDINSHLQPQSLIPTPLPPRSQWDSIQFITKCSMKRGHHLCRPTEEDPSPTAWVPSPFSLPSKCTEERSRLRGRTSGCGKRAGQSCGPCLALGVGDGSSAPNSHVLDTQQWRGHAKAVCSYVRAQDTHLQSGKVQVSAPGILSVFSHLIFDALSFLKAGNARVRGRLQLSRWKSSGQAGRFLLQLGGFSCCWKPDSELRQVESRVFDALSPFRWTESHPVPNQKEIHGAFQLSHLLWYLHLTLTIVFNQRHILFLFPGEFSKSEQTYLKKSDQDFSYKLLDPVTVS